MRRGVAVISLALAGAALLCGTAGAQQSARAEEARHKTVQVEGDHLEQTVRCTGNTIEITGSGSRISVLGSCAQVKVLGNRNTISVEYADRIVTSGYLNSVEYLNPRTRVTDTGKGNDVAEKWQR